LAPEWVRSRTRAGPERDQSGPRVVLEWAWSGSRAGPAWAGPERTGPEQAGPEWDHSGTGVCPDRFWNRIRAGPERDQSGSRAGSDWVRSGS